MYTRRHARTCRAGHARSHKNLKTEKNTKTSMESRKEKIEYPMSQLPGGGQTPQSTTLHVLLLTAGYRSSTEASSVCRRAIITTATFHPYIINLAIVFLIISLFFFFLAETNIYKLQQIKISSLLLYN